MQFIRDHIPETTGRSTKEILLRLLDIISRLEVCGPDEFATVFVNGAEFWTVLWKGIDAWKARGKEKAWMFLDLYVLRLFIQSPRLEGTGIDVVKYGEQLIAWVEEQAMTSDELAWNNPIFQATCSQALAVSPEHGPARYVEAWGGEIEFLEILRRRVKTWGNITWPEVLHAMREYSYRERPPSGDFAELLARGGVDISGRGAIGATHGRNSGKPLMDVLRCRTIASSPGTRNRGVSVQERA
jgi:hypothetical protein